MIILKVENGIIKDVAEAYDFIPIGYIERDIKEYPNDLMTGTYRFINGQIIRDNELYEIYMSRIAMEESQGGGYDGSRI